VPTEPKLLPPSYRIVPQAVAGRQSLEVTLEYVVSPLDDVMRHVIVTTWGEENGWAGEAIPDSATLVISDERSILVLASTSPSNGDTSVVGQLAQGAVWLENHGFPALLSAWWAVHKAIADERGELEAWLRNQPYGPTAVTR
jgi:hypothetical protein